MPHIDLVNMPASIIIGIVVMLVLAGMTKGLVGVGMPIVAVPLLNLLVDLPVTVAILSIPLIISNVPQALDGDPIGVVLRRLRPVLLGLVAGVVGGVYALVTIRIDLLKPLVGAILIVVVTLMLLSPHIVVPPKSEYYVGPLAGLVGGILGGLAALAGPFVFIYILALGLSKDRFVQYSSMYLVVASTLLTVTLGGFGGLGWRDALISTCAVIPIIVGMRLGAQLRAFVSPPMFRRLILLVVMVSGVHLVAGSISISSIAASLH
jgi:uncharacterized membrane protein YfcA